MGFTPRILVGRELFVFLHQLTTCLSLMSHTRSIYFDVVKGLAISLMVLGHCIDQANGWEWVVSGASSHHWLWRLIASFHMPLFMAVSGYFYSRSLEHNSIGTVIRQRALSLLIPSTLWSMLFIGICYGVHHLCYGGVTTAQTHAYLHRPIPALWFLWALFFSCVVVAIVRRWANDSPWVHGALIIATLFVPNVFFFPEIFSVHSYFVLAYYLGQHRAAVATLLQRNTFRRALLGTACIVYALLYIGMDEATTVYVSKFSLWGKYGAWEMLWRDGYRLVLGLSGTVVALFLTVELQKVLRWCKLEHLVAYTGTVSLGIYGLNNILCMGPRLLLIDVSPSLPRVFAVFAAMMLVSVGIMWGLSRYTFTRMWLLGKR